MSDESYPIEREEDEFGGRYVIRFAPGEDAEMTFRKTGAGAVTVDHTGVPPAYRGHGVAQLLMNRLIADAYAEGFRVVPLCSYVVAQFRRHPAWRDLLL
jgi:predicted GNAT family acetyltransferase